jgi:hypothetical protein
MKLGFEKWQNKSVGELGQLASFYARSYIFNMTLQRFENVDQVTLNK